MRSPRRRTVAVVPAIGELGAVDGIVTSAPIATHAAVKDALAADVPVFTENGVFDARPRLASHRAACCYTAHGLA